MLESFAQVETKTQLSDSFMHQLVVTAIGEDRPGIVSELTQLVSSTQCNIIDSRIAILGNEFTFIMLLAGDMAAISRVEHMIPTRSMELGLSTMTKRTSHHHDNEYNASYRLEYHGLDVPGTICKVTKTLADHKVTIAALKADSTEQDGQLLMHSELEINVSEQVDAEQLTLDLDSLFQQQDTQHTLTRIR